MRLVNKRFQVKERVFTCDKMCVRYWPVPWDSLALENKTYGVAIERLRNVQCAKEVFSELETQLNLKHGDLLVAKMSPSDHAHICALQAADFVFVEESLELAVDIAARPCTMPERITSGAYSFVPAEPCDIPAVLSIAETIFVCDRFHVDKRIPDTKANKRSRQWIENAVHDDDGIFVLKEASGTVVGFCTIHHPNQSNVADMHLIGIDGNQQKKGLGTLLLQASYAHLKQQGVRTMLGAISTINLPMINLITRLGSVQFTKPTAVFHKIITKKL